MKTFLKYSILSIVLFVVLMLVIQAGFFWYASTSPQWEYAKRALNCTNANYDFRYCMDLPKESRKDYTNSTWKPMACINTATSFYNPELRAANCNNFMKNPAYWGFEEVDSTAAVAGDMILFLRKEDGARHAGVYTMHSIIGPLCANTTNAGFTRIMPINPFLFIRANGFYKVKYYRYVGDKKE